MLSPYEKYLDQKEAVRYCGLPCSQEVWDRSPTGPEKSQSMVIYTCRASDLSLGFDNPAYIVLTSFVPKDGAGVATLHEYWEERRESVARHNYPAGDPPAVGLLALAPGRDLAVYTGTRLASVPAILKRPTTKPPELVREKDRGGE